jgi:hypothetical protein
LALLGLRGIGFQSGDLRLVRGPLGSLPLTLDPGGLALGSHLGLVAFLLHPLALLLGSEFGLALDALLLAGILSHEAG